MLYFRAPASLLITLLLSACASLSSTPAAESARVVKQAPRWYDDIDASGKFYEGRATSVSRDYQLAVENAAADARVLVSQEISVSIRSLVSRAAEQAGEAGNETAVRFSQTASKQVTDNVLRGARLDRQEVTAETDGRYRAWVRIRLARGEVAEAAQHTLQGEQALYARWRGTEALKQLDLEVAESQRAKASADKKEPRP